jgi:hypothetical protein
LPFQVKDPSGFRVNVPTTNGAGKITTIRILLGLLRKDGGEVSVPGADPWRDAVDLHQRLAYVPDEDWPTKLDQELGTERPSDPQTVPRALPTCGDAFRTGRVTLTDAHRDLHCVALSGQNPASMRHGLSRPRCCQAASWHINRPRLGGRG